VVMASSLELQRESRDYGDPWTEQKNYIQELIQQRGFSNEVIAALHSRGFQTSLSPLKTPLQAWGICRDAGVPGVKTGVSDELAEAINYLFHHNS
jgi:hypothetical protein